MNPMDIEFDSMELAMIDSGMADLIMDYREIREYHLANSTPPAIQFNPLPYGFSIPEPTPKIVWEIPEGVNRPSREADLAFMSIPELASLLRAGEVSCLSLTELYLKRLKKYDPQLHCVVSLTESYAIEQARKLDAELARGKDRGILHGIPYGAKDLFSFPGYPTTWGAGAYKEQKLDETAGIIKKLEDAGAILLAKTTLGALAMGDVWFADTTRIPRFQFQWRKGAVRLQWLMPIRPMSHLTPPQDSRDSAWYRQTTHRPWQGPQGWSSPARWLRHPPAF